MSQKTTSKKVDDRPVESLPRSVATIGLVVALCYAELQWQKAQPWWPTITEPLYSFFDSVPDSVAYVAVSVYFVVIMWHLYVRSESAKQHAKENSDWIKPLLIVWNYFLHVLSAWMFVGLILDFPYKEVNEQGINALLCDGDNVFRPGANSRFWVHIFMWSKFPELFDTAFLVIRGRDVLFLHWYHHITVLLYCWLVARLYYPGYVFAIVNAGVHTMMYYYYARLAQGAKVTFGKALTSIQLAQMVVGVSVAVYFGVMSGLYPESCTGGSIIAASDGRLRYFVLACTSVMYGSYFILFASFYVKKYKKE